MKVGIYIHIPFCVSRCIYCGFYSCTNMAMRKRYINALLQEIDMRSNDLYKLCSPSEICTIDTIYIGGGTPSVLLPEDLEQILKKINSTFVCETREVTVEVNPDDVTFDFISSLKSFGVNRISLGIQTFNDDRLKFIRRRHTASQACDAVETIRCAGISNVSIDLMFGFPDETCVEWQRDIEITLSLNPSHISAYCLMYEEGTQLYNMYKSGKLKPVDEDNYLKMYTMLVDGLYSNGYEHYEISNFAKSGCRSIHNSSYWHDIPYLGFGASAHSYLYETRSWNIDDIKKYVYAIEHGMLPSESETIDADTHYNDLITTALRTSDGLDLSSIAPKYKIYALTCAEGSIGRGLLEVVDNHLRLTKEGIFVSDDIMSDLIKI